jgi:cell cycle checkpoint protein
MAAPPAKRQRRLTLLASDDEDTGPLGAGKEKVLPTRSLGRHQTRASLPKASPKKSPKSKSSGKTPATKLGNQQSSQSPSKNNGLTKVQKPAASKSIQSFFNKKTEQQRVGGAEASPIILEDSGGDEIKDDYISDDISDGELLKGINSANDDQSQGTKKRPLSGARQDPASLQQSSSQRFRNDIKQSGITHGKTRNQSREDQRPWAERYGPINLEELAVHKKKVADVKDWLEGVFEHRLKQVGLEYSSCKQT